LIIFGVFAAVLALGLAEKFGAFASVQSVRFLLHSACC
jgi:hypothetical protein